MLVLKILQACSSSQVVTDSRESDSNVSHEDVNLPTSHDSDNPEEMPALFMEQFKLRE